MWLAKRVKGVVELKDGTTKKIDKELVTSSEVPEDEVIDTCLILSNVYFDFERWVVKPEITRVEF